MNLFVMRQRVLAGSLLVFLAATSLFPVSVYAVPIAEAGGETPTAQPASNSDDIVTNDDPAPAPTPVVVDRGGKSDLMQSSGDSSSRNNVPFKSKTSLLSLYREWKAEQAVDLKPAKKVDVAAFASAFIIEPVAIVAVADCYVDIKKPTKPLAWECDATSLY